MEPIKTKYGELIQNEISVTLNHYEVPHLRLSYSDKLNYESLRTLSRLEFLRYVKNRTVCELEIADLVSQSDSIYALKDNLGVHLRSEDLSTLTEKDELILEYVNLYYSMHLVSTISYPASGDINRTKLS